MPAEADGGAVPRDAGPFRFLRGRHGLFAAPVGDSVIAACIARTGGFAEGQVRVLSALAQPGATVVDVGANIGTVAMPLARRVGPQGRVIAFEPMRVPFLCLCAGAALNGLAQIEPRQQAVGEAAGEQPLPDFDPAAPGNHGAISLRGAVGTQRVPRITIDSLALEHLALLKIDAEGMDWQVLRGARETIRRCRPAIYLEAGADRAARAQGIGALQAEGYDWFWQFAFFVDPSTLADAQKNPFPNTGDVNLLALPPGHPARHNLAPVSAPDADWREDFAAHRRGIA